jgi:hypothetical protein
LRISDALHGRLRILVERTLEPMIGPEATMLCLIDSNESVVVRIADTDLHERLLSEGRNACLPICRALGEATLFDDVGLVIFERQVPEEVHEIVGAGWERFWREDAEGRIPQAEIDRLHRRFDALYAALRRWPASVESIRRHVDRIVTRTLWSLP